MAYEYTPQVVGFGPDPHCDPERREAGGRGWTLLGRAAAVLTVLTALGIRFGIQRPASTAEMVTLAVVGATTIGALLIARRLPRVGFVTTSLAFLVTASAAFAHGTPSTQTASPVLLCVAAVVLASAFWRFHLARLALTVGACIFAMLVFSPFVRVHGTDVVPAAAPGQAPVDTLHALPDWLKDCDIPPGAGLPMAVANAAIDAVVEGAAPTFGCLDPVSVLPDGTAVQEFRRGRAVLVMSEDGAGVVIGPTLKYLREHFADLSRRSMGGQILNRIRAWGRTGDLQPMVRLGAVSGLLIRRRSVDVDTLGSVFSPLPILVPAALMAAYFSELLHGRVLVPVAPAKVEHGMAAQRLLDPADDDYTVILRDDAGAMPPPAFTVEELLRRCGATCRVDQ